MRDFLAQTIKLLFTSPGGAAILTAIFGGFAAGLVSTIIQNNFKARELLLIDEREYTKERIEAARNLYKLTGRAIAISREALPVSQFDSQTPTPSIREEEGLIEQRMRIRKDYNGFVREWNEQREPIGLQLLYYYPCAPDVVTAWTGVEEATNQYLTCAVNTNSAQDVQNCVQLYYEINGRLENLTNLLLDEWKRAAQSDKEHRHWDCNNSSQQVNQPIAALSGP